MARRLTSGGTTGRRRVRRQEPAPRRDRAGPGREQTRTRRARQLLVWVLSLTVFCGLALLSGQSFGSGTTTATSGRPASSMPVTARSTAPVSPAAGTAVAGSPAGTDSGGQVVAAPMELTDGGTADADSRCSQYNEQRDFLPLNRWTSFSLHTVDNAWLLKTRLFISMIASLLLMAAALMWRIIGMLMGFSYTFDMVCSAADPINQVVRAMSFYAGWFLIPSWLVVLAAAFRRWTAGGRAGPASAVRLVASFLAATGLIFFIGNQAVENENNPTGKYTVPWMAATVQSWFTEFSTAMAELPDVSQTNSVFYDDDPTYSGKVTCANLARTLEDTYLAENEGGFPGSAAMLQVNRMWEISLVRSWMSAQVGDGTPENPAPAHAACRVLEANASVDDDLKLKAYDLANGDPVDTTTAQMMRGFFIAPKGSLQTIAIAWGACKVDAGQGGRIHTTPQWDNADVGGKEDSCNALLSDADTAELSDWLMRLYAGQALDTFYFNGGDELNDKLGDCINDEVKAEACRYLWDHIEAWLGANQTERLTQGLMSTIVAFVFLFVLGPMAVGLMLISVALAGLSMLLPISLLLFATGLDAGKRLLKLTGAAAVGKFLFTLALTLLALIIDMTYLAINESIQNGTPTPGFFEQVAQGAAPLVALYLFKKLTRFIGLGDISSMTGALGFAGAAALKATGDRNILRPYDDSSAQRMSGALGRVGWGDKRLSALDETSLQRRMLSNPATRALGQAAWNTTKAGVRRGVEKGAEIARPVTTRMGNLAGAVAGGAQRRMHALAEMAKSGSPAQRAAAYAGLTALLAASPASGALMPVVAATSGAALIRGSQAAWRGFKNERARWGDVGRYRDFLTNGGSPPEGAFKPGEMAGTPMAEDARAARRSADRRHRNIIRVSASDKEAARAITNGEVKHTLDMMLARQRGAGHPDGLNPSPKNFANELEKELALREISKKTGLAPERIILSDTGLYVPEPAATDERTGRPNFPEETPDWVKKHWVNYMDEATRRPQIGETPTQRVTRLVAQAMERGYVTTDGESIDVTELHDKNADHIKIRSRRPERDAIQASREWVEEQAPIRLGPEHRHLEAMQVVMEKAHDEMGNFRTSAAGLQLEFDRKFDEMKRVLKQELQLHQSAPHMDLETARMRSGELTGLHNDQARQLDELSRNLRDLVDAATQARGTQEIVAHIADRGMSTDTADLSLEIQRLREVVQNRQDMRHEDIERLVGSISPVPRNESDAHALVDSLDEFRMEIKRLISNEVWTTRDTEERLRTLREVNESSAHVHRNNPRTATDMPINSQLLLRMHARN